MYQTATITQIESPVNEMLIIMEHRSVNEMLIIMDYSSIRMPC